MTPQKCELVCLAEECVEVSEELIEAARQCSALAKQVHKSLRFGLDDQITYDPRGPRGSEGPTNQQKIIDELNDLLGMTKVLEARGILPSNWQDEKKQNAKVTRVAEFMLYSQRIGAVTADPEFTSAPESRSITAKMDPQSLEDSVWEQTLLDELGPGETYEEGIRRAGEPVFIDENEEFEGSLYSVSLADGFWMDSFRTRKDAQDFIARMGWPYIPGKEPK